MAIAAFCSSVPANTTRFQADSFRSSSCQLHKRSYSFPSSLRQRQPSRHNTRATSPPTERETRVSTITSKRERIAPGDEAFATCDNCGNDELVSAEKLMKRGSVRVSCSQCRNEFTAEAATALSINGTSLMEERKQERLDNGEQEPLATIVKLYVSGLGPKVDNNALREAVAVYGEVTDVNIVYDRNTRRSRGFGFVSVVGKSVADAIMEDLSGSNILGGRRLNIREAIE